MEKKYKKISVIGAGISGTGAAKLAIDLGAKVFISDNRPAEKLEEELKSAQIFSKVEFEGGGQSDKIYDCDLIVVSPAVWRTSPIFEEAKKRGIEVIGELEFAFRASKCKWLAITGSTGKSTTTAMINAIFDETDIPHCLCGNIGFSAAELAPKLPKNGVAICEISSFQLETIKEFCPDIAVILNLYPNHLDRHASLEEYYSTKLKISQNMKNGLKITTSENELLKNWAKNEAEHYFYNEADDEIINKIKNKIKLAGTHNLYNAVIGYKSAKYFDINEDKILSSLSKFAGLEHRMEFCAELNGVRYFNDSKSTTGESMLAAISGFAPKSVHLIVGGKDKGVPFADYKKTIYDNCAKVYAIGEAAKRIKDCWGDSVIDCETLTNAVETAKNSAKSGDVVILSPACASFDQFKGFEDRGKKFKEIVQNLQR
ncbi:MAG: UDP-N-acetylmuramoyl-L-alanine--D-glutamate ligase [Chitinivibrionia bacterium]|nr:UDP-N-acetylmuramoyl-L-alanine--D-glutamate ligase [Chitinivibrionia bacterium]